MARGLVPSRPFPTCLRRPHLFRLAGKDGGEKGRWGTFGAYCGCGSGRNLIFSCCEHAKPPYVRYGTRRLLWYTDFSSSCDSISAAKSLAFETCRVVRIRRSSFWCRTGAGAPLAPLGEAGCGAKRSRLMRGYAAAFASRVINSCFFIVCILQQVSDRLCKV